MQRWDIIVKGMVRAASKRVNSELKIERVMSGGKALQAEGNQHMQRP